MPPVPTQPVPVTALKNPHLPVRRHMAPRDLRDKTRGPHTSAVETVHFLSKNCGDSSVLFKELSRQYSSYQRTVETVLFLSKNCGDSSVLIKELWRQFCSYQRTVETVLFLSKNCGDSSVLIKELWRQFSSYQRTVQTVQFLSKNGGHSSKDRNCSRSSLHCF